MMMGSLLSKKKSDGKEGPTRAMMPHEKRGKVAWRALAKVPADPSGVAQECVGQVLALVDTRPHDVLFCSPPNAGSWCVCTCSKVSEKASS